MSKSELTLEQIGDLLTDSEREEWIADGMPTDRLDPNRPITPLRRFMLADGVQGRIDDCLKAIAEVVPKDPTFAGKLRDSLDHCFRTLERLAHSDSSPRLMLDHAPLSFLFDAGGFFGGLICHGAHDGHGSGGPPTYSVCLEPTTGWQIHT